MVNLGAEKVTHDYTLYEREGRLYKWRHTMGRSLRDADFVVSFAKGKTHHCDWYTLCMKNMYGCMPEVNKSYWYHEYSEVRLVTAALLCEKQVDYCFIDAWICSDGVRGYVGVHETDKDIDHMGGCAKKIGMVFASPDIAAIDKEFATRAGGDYRKMMILQQYVRWARGGEYPEYDVLGSIDERLRFSDLVEWENVPDEVVEETDWRFEENTILFVTRLPNPIKFTDTELFPLRSWLHRLVFLAMKFILYKIMDPIRVALGLRYL